MRSSKLALLFLLVVSTNTFAENSDDQALVEYEKQISKFWSQAKETDQQLMESGKQLATTNQMLEQQQKQLDRQAVLLGRWERILKRHEALLNAWEQNEEKAHNKAMHRSGISAVGSHSLGNVNSPPGDLGRYVSQER